MKFVRFLLCLLMAFAWFPRADGHEVSTVEFEFQDLDTQWRLLGEMDIAFMLPEMRGVPGSQPLSRKKTMEAPPEELARIRAETEKTLRRILRLSFAGKDVAWRIEFPDFEKTPFSLPAGLAEEMADWALLSTRIVTEKLPGPGELRVHWNDDQNAELIILVETGDDPQVTSVSPGHDLLLLEVAAGGESKITEHPAAWSWIVSGFGHVLPKGLDHLLFILGLFLLLPKWKPLMGQSLLFTLAHSITLALAVMGWVSVPSRPVEILIAASIAWIGIENLLTRKLGKQRLTLVFLFGLLHGLGFASVLSEKLGSLTRPQLVMPLLGFNIGVELAQITVLAAAFLFLWPLRKWTRQVQMYGSAFVALAGLGWLFERLFLTPGT